MTWLFCYLKVHTHTQSCPAGTVQRDQRSRVNSIDWFICTGRLCICLLNLVQFGHLTWVNKLEVFAYCSIQDGPLFAVLEACIAWKPEKEREKEREWACSKQIVDMCMQGCLRDGEMKRVIILLLPWGLSQPRRLPIGPLTHALAESQGPLIGPCDNTREKGNVCVDEWGFVFWYYSAVESLCFLQVIIYWFVILLWRVFDL